MKIVALYRFAIACLCLSISSLAIAGEGSTPASLEQVLASKEDLWGLSAMQQKNGASYEFFANLLPPLRYVNAAFRYYPIVLSAPGGFYKGRLVSNGSAVNPHPVTKTWLETGMPVSFFVGQGKEPFGTNFESVEGPHYERGYLPIVQIHYRNGEATYIEETFASVDFTNQAVVFTRFSFEDGKAGIVSAHIDLAGQLHSTNNSICDEKGRVLVSFSKLWRWDDSTRTLTAHLFHGDTASLAIASLAKDSQAQEKFAAADYDAQKKKCVAKWEGILSKAMRVKVPEMMVNNAWKSTILGNLMLLRGDHMNYSAGNQYETMYEAESGDAADAMLLWNMEEYGRKMIPPLLDFGKHPGLRFHDAAFKLQLLAEFYWLTRDAQFIRNQKTRWTKCVATLSNERDAATGLLPREAYCGDEADKVFSLNSNANAWRGLRDMSLVLEQIGEKEDAHRISEIAEKLHTAILAAVDKSERRDVVPSFIPIALFGEEKPSDVLTATRRSSYWDLMIPYVISSGIFAGTELETSMLHYLQEHGGTCMGMIRFDQHSGLFANVDGLDDCYGLRYTGALLRRDEPELALVSFYGKLAQGMTRETFLSAEGTGLRPLDAFGRPMYLPPICTGSAFFLSTLRSLLIQDYVENDGSPKTLRLLFATPRRWLEDEKEINVQNAPTAFGEASINVKSRLKHGEVIANVKIPERNRPEKVLLKIRLPEPWKLISAKGGSQVLKVDENGTVDISSLAHESTIRFKVH